MLYGSQTPTFRHSDDYASTDGRKAGKLLTMADASPLEWQQLLLDDWLARRPDGRWSHATCCGLVPRQNGKTRGTAGRIAWGMVAYGEWVVYTSHLQKTSTETFEELAALFDTPALRKMVKTVKTALGREEILLTNGGRCKFLARTRNGGRGQHGDLWIADECQELTDEQQGSFLPLLAASKNPQTVYIGTPPDENASGEVLTRIRSDARSGKGGIAYAEWCVDEIGDTSDEARWAKTNPSLGYLINLDTIRAEHSQLAPDRFARERLCWFPDRASAANVISEALWSSLAVDDTPSGGVDSYGVKFSADGARVAVSVCRKTDEGYFVELLFDEPTDKGTNWLAERIVSARDRVAMVAVDGKSGASSFALKLDAMPKGSVHVISTAEAIVANTSLVSYANDGTLSHRCQRQLMDSATKTTRRKIGTDGGYGFGDTESAQAAPIESAALAIWAADHTKRKPGRKQRII